MKSTQYRMQPQKEYLINYITATMTIITNYHSRLCFEISIKATKTLEF